MADIEYSIVNEDGTQAKSEAFDASSDKVYVIVDHKARVISLWKGISAPVRLKFIGSRASGDTRKEVGFHYKLEVMDQGDESKSFKERILGDANASTGGATQTNDTAPEHLSYAQMAEKQGIKLDDDDLKRNIPTGKFGKMGGITNRPQRSFLTGMTDEDGSQISKKQIVKAIQTDVKKEARKIMRELGDPKGYNREMVVIGDSMYRVIGSGAEVDFEELDNPIDGIVLVKEYTPRIIAEGGNIKVMELLRRTSEDDEEDEVMSQDLSDLTSMFQIEIE